MQQWNIIYEWVVLKGTSSINGGCSIEQLPHGVGEWDNHMA